MPHNPLQVARRVDAIEPFRVMEMVKAAASMVRAGQDVISMSVGEPDFTAPDLVARAAMDAIQRGATQYTESLGLPALREAISAHYARAYGLEISPRRIVVTAGASAGLLLACAALVAEGDEVLMPDPSYPCNRHFVSAFGGQAVLVPSGPAERCAGPASKKTRPRRARNVITGSSALASAMKRPPRRLVTPA